MFTKLFLIFKTPLIACLFSFFLLSITNAQDKGIYEITSGGLNNDRTHFYDLALKLHPTIYVSNSEIIKINGDGKIKKMFYKILNR